MSRGGSESFQDSPRPLMSFGSAEYDDLKRFSGDISRASIFRCACLHSCFGFPHCCCAERLKDPAETHPKVRHTAGVAGGADAAHGLEQLEFLSGNVTDKDIRNAADQLVATGMKDAGYVYVNIDDTWEGDRDADGVLHTNSKFPDMKALADYVHSKGLKLGIYSSPGPKTCAGYAGFARSRGAGRAALRVVGHRLPEVRPVQLYSRAVMTKQAPDDKAAQMRLMIAAYDKMDKALKATGRPIVYSLCQYGWDAVWEWGPSVGANLWRTTGDIQPNWHSIYSILNEQAGPGEIRRPRPLERSRHARSGQRQALAG